MEIFRIEAFRSDGFAGNPAGVCLLNAPCSTLQMQNIASRLKFSETAFIGRLATGFSLRWFTPVTEVKLCGHATLASAHLLFEAGIVSRQIPIVFHTASGRLTAIHCGDWLHIDLPAAPARPCTLPAGLLAALGLKSVVFAGKNQLDYSLVVDSAEAVRALRPNFPSLAGSLPAHGVMVSSRTDQAGFDYVCRYFDPAEGIDEDPVTGSAHCCLGPYWQQTLGKDSLSACQLSERGGLLQVSPVGARVVLSGQAQTVWQKNIADVAITAE